MASQQQQEQDLNNTIEDIFESSLNLEETHFKEGYTLGYTDGIASGEEDAKQVGLKHGFQIGEELGFYKGCVDVWNSAIRIDPTRFSARTQKKIKTMEDLVRKYPILEPENESVQEIMDSLRNEFRAVCMNLRVKLEYDGYPKPFSSDVKDVEF